LDARADFITAAGDRERLAVLETHETAPSTANTLRFPMAARFDHTELAAAMQLSAPESVGHLRAKAQRAMKMYAIGSHWGHGTPTSINPAEEA